MKKIVFYLMVLFMSAFSWQSIAQVTIGDQSGITTNLPITGCWDYSYSQQLVYQSEINASGDISSVSFYYDSGGTNNSSGWTIYMGHTSKTAFSNTTDWIGIANLTQVYTGTVTFPAAKNWMTITFQTPFPYNNVDNLVIAVDENQPSYNCSPAFGKTASGVTKGIYYYSNGTNPDPTAPPAANSLAVFTNNIILGGIQQSCPAPTAFNTSNITQTTVDVSWTPGDSETSWNISWGGPDYIPGVDIPTGTHTYNDPTPPYTYQITNLTSDTNYDVYVQASCGIDGESSWEGPLAVYTGYCIPSSSNTSDYLSAISTIGAVTDVSYTASSMPVGGYSDQTSLDFRSYETQTFNISTNYVSGANGVNIWIDWNNNLAFDLDESVASQRGLGGKTFPITIPAATPQGEYRMRVRGQFSVLPPACGNINWGSAVDFTLTVIAPPTCWSPTDLINTEVTTNTADIIWTPSNSETAWNISWGTPGYSPGDANEVRMVSTSDATVYQIEDLSPGTQYEFYVQADCGEGNVSLFTGPQSFFTLPVNDNLCDVTPIIVGATSDGDAYTNVGATAEDGEPNGSCWSGTENPQTVWFSFEAPSSGDVIVTTDIEGGTLNNTHIAIYELPSNCLYFATLGMEIGCNEDGGTGTKAEATITGLVAGSTYYIQVDGNGSQTGTFGLEVRDNGCTTPTDLSVDEVTANSANISWTAGGSESDWEVRYGTRGFDPNSEGTPISVLVSPNTTLNLDPGTEYDVYVKAYCLNGDSSFAGPVSFFTTPPDTDYFITTWHTTSDIETITIPTTGNGYNYRVDWGDGVTETNFSGNASHIYADAGEYQVKIYGDFPRIYFNNAGDKLKIKAINQWGTNAWSSMKNAFYGCSNLTGNATDTPDLSGVSDMSGMFQAASTFNQDIGNWNLGNWNNGGVTNMASMFKNASTFNQDINNWFVGSVTDMSSMFEGAIVFDQNIGNWEVSYVTTMENMFDGVTLSTANYDALLTGWNSNNLQDGVIFSGGNSKYCAGEAARTNMITDYNWTITDGGITIPLIAVCKNITVELDENGSVTITGNDVDDGSSVGCTGSPTFTVSPDTFTCINIGDNIVTLTVTDGNGNESTCTSTVTVIDNEVPVITCVADAIRDADLGVNHYTVISTEFDPSFSDNCSDASISNDYNGTATLENETLPIGSTNIIWTVDDGNGQTAICTTVVTVLANDSLCNAITLIIDATSDGDAYTNVGATIQPDEPIGSCWSGTATKTVWFTFEAPASGNVTVSTDIAGGTLTDTHIAIYEDIGLDCNDLSTLGAEVGCDGDGGVIVNHNSIAKMTGLTAGNTYYVQVEGYNSKTGTFGLEVKDDGCIKPTNLSIADVTANTADFSWTSNGSETAWVVRYGAPGFDPLVHGTAIPVSDTPNTTLNNLAANTGYDVYVKSDCGSGTSIFVGPVTFITAPANDNLCDAISLTIGVVSAGNAYTNVKATAEAAEPNGSCWTGTANPQTVWFSFEAPNSGNVTVSTDIAGGTLTNTHIAIYEAPANCSNLATLGDEVGCDEDGGIGNNNHRSIASLSGLTPGNTYYIQVGGNGSDTGTLGIEVRDDGCLAPTNLAVDASTDTSADISWTKTGNESDWIVKYSDNLGFDPDNQGVLVAVNGLPNTVLNGLDPNTTYEFYVKADCGNGEESDFVGPMNLTTLCLGSPTLSFLGAGVFQNSIVSPTQGAPETTYQFAVVYTNQANVIPPFGFPRVLLDYEGNGVFTNVNDRAVILSEADPNDLNTADGKVYMGSITQLPSGMNWESWVQVQSGGCTIQMGAFNAPHVLIAPDLEIFANDIVFDNPNPDVSSPLQITATIHNKSDLAADNFVVHLVNQFDPLEVYPDITVAHLEPHQSKSVVWNITTPAVPSWNPMEVFVDFTNVIIESNELNNRALRPFTNGDYNVPGAINVQASAIPSIIQLPSRTGSVTISGYAYYTDTAVVLQDSTVAGATVTFISPVTGAQVQTHTNARGYFSFNTVHGSQVGVYGAPVEVTDFTITGETPVSWELIQGPCITDLSTYINPSSTSILVGDSVSGTITVINSGCEPVGVQTLLETNQTGGLPLIGNIMVPPLDPGESFIHNFTAQFNAVGTYYITALADAGFVLNESYENNNLGSSTIRVNPRIPDIVPNSNDYMGSEYLCSTSNTQSFSIGNIGYVPTGAFDSTIDVYFGGNLEASFTRNIQNINAGEWTSVSIPYVYPQLGRYSFVVTCDIPMPNGVVVEISENNNIGNYYIDIIECRPDLNILYCEDLVVSPVDPQFPGAVTYTAKFVMEGMRQRKVLWIFNFH